jgi:hypothetical protein
MSMSPFASRFPELGMRETRVAVFPDEDDPMKGRYAFMEFYCNDETCDCRRVVLNVINESDPRKILASINYGWESPSYYAKWVGSSDASRGMAGATLDPMLTQSLHSNFFLDYFNDVILQDPAYVERLQRHYAMFKGSRPPRSHSWETHDRSWRKQRAKLGAPKRRKRRR